MSDKAYFCILSCRKGEKDVFFRNSTWFFKQIFMSSFSQFQKKENYFVIKILLIFWTFFTSFWFRNWEKSKLESIFVFEAEKGQNNIFYSVILQSLWNKNCSVDLRKQKHGFHLHVYLTKNLEIWTFFFQFVTWKSEKRLKSIFFQICFIFEKQKKISKKINIEVYFCISSCEKAQMMFLFVIPHHVSNKSLF